MNNSFKMTDFPTQLSTNIDRLCKRLMYERTAFVAVTGLLGEEIEQGDLETLLSFYRTCAEFIGVMETVPLLMEKPGLRKIYETCKGNLEGFDGIIASYIIKRP